VTEKLRRIEGSIETGFGFKCKVPTEFGLTAADKGYNELCGDGIPTLGQAMALEKRAYAFLTAQRQGKADPEEESD
jgi:hypothetical protein